MSFLGYPRSVCGIQGHIGSQPEHPKTKNNKLCNFKIASRLVLKSQIFLMKITELEKRQRPSSFCLEDTVDDYLNCTRTINVWIALQVQSDPYQRFMRRPNGYD